MCLYASIFTLIIKMDTPTSPINVGLRVKHAREQQDLTQEELSVILGFKDRQTISDIEKGKRAVKTEELLKLSEVFDRDLEFFLDPFSVIAEAQYSWRATPTLPEDVLNQFEEKASGWIGMLRWLREQETNKPSPLRLTLGLNMSSSFENAQLKAEQLVEKFSLGVVPALRLAEFVESVLDIPVLFVDADVGTHKGSISGAACHLPEMGVILVNRRESEGRRNFDLAHELFHSLTWESIKPEHREPNTIEAREKTKRVEQLADNFAAALLMPRATLGELIDSTRLEDTLHLAEVAGQLHVTVHALAVRLKNLGRIDKEALQRILQIARSDSTQEVPLLFSHGFVNLLSNALGKGRISARKAAKTLGLSLHEMTQLFESHRLPAPFSL